MIHCVELDRRETPIEIGFSAPDREYAVPPGGHNLISKTPATSQSPTVPRQYDESNEVAWIDLAEISKYTDEESVLRMARVCRV
jgi:hypothetical protein